MSRLPGQAARGLVVILHRLATFALLLTILAGVGGAWAAWRLSQGPVDLPWLAHRIEDAVNGDNGPTRLKVGSAALAWEGFRMGVDRPLDIRLLDVTAADAAGVPILSVPRAEVSLSLGSLLLGHIRPRAIEVERPRLRVLRGPDGSIAVDLGSLSEADESGEPAQETDTKSPPEASSFTALMRELANPPESDRNRHRVSRYSQLRRVRIRDANVIVVDRKLGAAWRIVASDVDFVRQPKGGVQGKAAASFELGDQRAGVLVSAALDAGGAASRVRIRLSPVDPAALARAAPGLAALGMLDAPVSGEAEIDLGPRLALQQVRLNADVGSGQARIGATTIPLVGAALVASGTPDNVNLQTLRITLRGHEAGLATVLQTHGVLRREPDKLRAELGLDLDQAAFADLPRLWPEGVGGGARGWITQNITAGTARNGHIDLALEGTTDLARVALTSASGTLDGDGLTVHWLRPVPPIDHAQAKLRVIDPDTIEITAQSGRQRQEGKRGETGTGGLAVRGGRMRITGITHPDQFGAIEIDAAGGLPDVIALLRNPRLQLLSKHPVDLRDPAGQVSVRLNVQLPLDNNVQMEQIAIRTQAHLDGVHLTAIAAGRDLDQGVLDLEASDDGMKLNGRALLANIPAEIAAEMDFRAGPPSQVLQKISVSGEASAKQLAAAGLDAGAALSGSAALQATLTERRDGRGQLDVAADLTQAELAASPLAWRKPAGNPATGSARLRLSHDKLVGVDNILVSGARLDLRGRADYAGGAPSLLRLDRIVLGRTQATGTVRFPPANGTGPIQATFNGQLLDLSARMSRRNRASEKPPEAKEDSSQPWAVDARFDRAIMGEGRAVTAIVLNVEDDGRVMRRLHLEARTAPNAGFRLDILPDRGGRKLTASANDAGGLLRVLDLMDTMQGGVLTVSGSYDDSRADHPLSGSAEIRDFRVRNAPALARLLQAMTLYGLVEMTQGPGLGFTRLVAPFTLAGDTLDLADARAFSPSLGLTAKGRVNLASDRADMEGTIVPAYFFNSLLGNVPLVGRLFSPEKGGGLFAASYTIRGPLADPQVSVNPLSALTPGFLRGVFGIF